MLSMISMQSIELPAHSDIRPQPLKYEPACGEVADALLRQLRGSLVTRARTAHPAPFGYYRVDAEPALFVKVVPSARLPRLLAVQQLVTKLAAEGCPVQPMRGAPLTLSENATGLTHAYVVERFACDKVQDATSVGAALRSIHTALKKVLPPCSADRISGQWHRTISTLFHARYTDEFVSSSARALLRHWQQLAATLDRNCQLIHGDYHRGNVLMAASGVAAVLDFDDAVSTVASPLVDIATGVERFCMAGAQGELGAKMACAFLDGYGCLPAEVSANEIARVASARSLFGCSILHANPQPDDPVWCAE